MPLWLSLIAYPCALGNGVPSRCLETRATTMCGTHVDAMRSLSRTVYTDKPCVCSYVEGRATVAGWGSRGLRMWTEIKTQTSVVFFLLIIQSFNKFLYESHVQLFIFFYCFDGCCCWVSRFPLFVICFLFFFISNCYKLTWF